MTYLEPPASARALLFDCDGTLVDTMGLYRQVWAKLLGVHGFVMTDSWWLDNGAVPLVPFVRAALPDADAGLIEQLKVTSIDDFRLRLHELEPLDRVVDVARRHRGVLPQLVVSGGYRDSVVGSLDAVGISGLFDGVITADDVVDSKPAPDMYLLALDRLSLAPHEVVVYEDSEVGIAAATAAGIGAIIDVRAA